MSLYPINTFAHIYVLPGAKGLSTNCLKSACSNDTCSGRKFPSPDPTGKMRKSHRILQERCEKVTGSCRKTPEIDGTWKQYFGRKLSRFFPMDSCQLPVLSDRNRPEYCFHKSMELPGTDRYRAGIFDLGVVK